MTAEDRATYLETGKGMISDPERLDLIRDLLASPVLWSEPPPGLADGSGASFETHPEPGSVHRWNGWRVPLVAGVAAMAVLLVGILGVFDRPMPEPTAVAALAGTELMPAASGTATVRDISSGWAVRLEVDGLPPAPEGSFYQGWVWNSEGEGVSMGTFHLRGGNYPVTLWAGVELTDYPWIWVTLQDEGAGPGASDRVLLRGKIEGLDE